MTTTSSPTATDERNHMEHLRFELLKAQKIISELRIRITQLETELQNLRGESLI